MTLYVSKFHKDAPAETTGTIAELDLTHGAAMNCQVAECDGIDIPGESPMRIHVSCTDQSYVSITIFQDGSNIINFVAALKSYAHAMIQFRSGYFLEIHVEREKLQKV